MYHKKFTEILVGRPLGHLNDQNLILLQEEGRTRLVDGLT
jgi:hypothetical protein